MQGGGQFFRSELGDPHGLDPHARERRDAAPDPAKPRRHQAQHGKGHKPFGWLHPRHEPRHH
ncbi:hypothetical protein KDL01_14960 [Actinospica durhamensis]|uniref:Uncharacterized protein n=1 Tax=Actinospica durhamensis TaxID=1508375 RepID=A0A941EMT5_9ACTN|nr:hypothetical protein [Actinospica durhamensis]MBR7834572.1 hypothetical protein [Actinospica durhamensis]